MSRRLELVHFGHGKPELNIILSQYGHGHGKAHSHFASKSTFFKNSRREYCYKTARRAVHYSTESAARSGDHFGHEMSGIGYYLIAIWAWAF